MSTPIPALPDDSLAAIADEAWARLARGAADRRTAFHQMQLATLTPQGWPDLRRVILRAVDPAERRIGFHTDQRSAKAADIMADGRVALHLWDPRAELQLRLWGQAAIETEGAAVEAAWARLAPHQRRVYFRAHAPGTALRDPAEADPADTPPPEGHGAFALVAVTVARFEWLHLRATGHRRARFDWQKGWTGRWLAP